MPSQNFEWTRINHSIGQLTENRTANIFAPLIFSHGKLARDGSIIKRPYSYPTHTLTHVRMRRWRELAKDKG